MKTGNILAMAISLVLVIMLPFASAQGTEVTDDAAVVTEDAATNESAAPKVTFGTCVSEAAKLKNMCYASEKDKAATCKSADKKSKECRKVYKVSKKQCKMAFKAAKKECRKLKHNFIDEAKVAFK